MAVPRELLPTAQYHSSPLALVPPLPHLRPGRPGARIRGGVFFGGDEAGLEGAFEFQDRGWGEGGTWWWWGH